VKRVQGEIRKSNKDQYQNGQATLEYILLLFFVISFSTLLTRGILKSYNLSIQKFNGALEKDLKTGKTPQEVFKNDT